jgi:membrane-bound inhibitor of C-type lysozyme
MYVFPIAALATLLCAGCAVTADPAKAAGERRVRFACSNGEVLEMRFLDLERVAVLVRSDEAIELAQQESASGFIYSNGPTTVRGKGSEMKVQIGRMTAIECSARQ